ncbi:MAG TPA: hypothetical protein VKM93_15260 [Terriglobia bacterium]|nr:hypothetical protein [Terriglobia bacterium]
MKDLVTYDDWFERKVKESSAAAERGEAVPDEVVEAWVEELTTADCRLEEAATDNGLATDASSNRQSANLRLGGRLDAT